MEEIMSFRMLSVYFFFFSKYCFNYFKQVLTALLEVLSGYEEIFLMDFIICLKYFKSKHFNKTFSLQVFPSWQLLVQSYNRNTRIRREICSKLTIRTPEWRHWRCPGVFIINFEHILHLVLVFLLLTLNMQMAAGLLQISVR